MRPAISSLAFTAVGSSATTPVLPVNVCLCLLLHDADVITQICPEANILVKQDYTNPNKREKNIDIYTTSIFYSSDKYEKNIQAAINFHNEGTILCCAVGNDASASCTSLSKHAH